MSSSKFRFAVLSVVKHDYVPLSVAAHPRFEPVVVADDPEQPDWVHARNEEFARRFGIPYVRNVERALADFDVQVAVVSSQAERHCDLSVRAANTGLHVIQDKPMSTLVSECDRVIEAVERNHVKFLLWNRNFLPAVIQACESVQSGAIGQLQAIHVDFYFAKDAGAPKGTRMPGDMPIGWEKQQQEAHATGADGGVGQGPMGELQIEGIYPLAYIHALTGSSVRRVFARTTAHFHQAHFDNGVEDLATVTLEMDRDVVGTLCIGRIGAASHPDTGEIKIHLLGSQGALVIGESRPEVGIYYRGQPEKEYRHQRVADDNNFLLPENLARAIDNDGDTILNARVGRAIGATVQAAVESGKSGKPVEVR